MSAVFIDFVKLHRAARQRPPHGRVASGSPCAVDFGRASQARAAPRPGYRV